MAGSLLREAPENQRMAVSRGLLRDAARAALLSRECVELKAEQTAVLPVEVELELLRFLAKTNRGECGHTWAPLLVDHARKFLSVTRLILRQNGYRKLASFHPTCYRLMYCTVPTSAAMSIPGSL